MAIEDDSYGGGWAPGDIKLAAYGQPGLTLAGGEAAATPAAAPIGGDLDVRMAFVANDYTPVGDRVLALQWPVGGPGGTRSWTFRLQADGTLRHNHSADGTALSGTFNTTAPNTLAAAAGVTDGDGVCTRLTHDIGTDVRFWWKEFDAGAYMDALRSHADWNLIQTVASAATGIFDTTEPIRVAGDAAINTTVFTGFEGRAYGLVLLDNIDGNEVVVADYLRALGRQDDFTDESGHVWILDGTSHFSINPSDGWLPCDGKVYDIVQYPELFEVIGATFGGDGITTFAVPNMSGRFPLGALAPGTGAGTAAADGRSAIPTNPAANTGSGSSTGDRVSHYHIVPHTKLCYLIRT